MNVAGLLRDEIRRRGIRQNEAAQIMDVGQALLSKWLGENPPRPSSESCAKIAAFVGVDPTTILRLAGHLSLESGPAATKPRDIEKEMALREVAAIYDRTDRRYWPVLTNVTRGAAAGLPIEAEVERNPEEHQGNHDGRDNVNKAAQEYDSLSQLLTTAHAVPVLAAASA
jgi:transcriptional regulator with XRE-family HTH domain